MSSPNDTHCALLELAAELRNRIYELVLVSEVPINVTRQLFKEPPLLTACHQVRNETLQIYYDRNIFSLDARCFDSTVTMKWCKKANHLVKTTKVSRLVCRISCGRSVNWSNLMIWLRRFHSDDTTLALDLDSMPDAWHTFKIVDMMFRTVEDLDDFPWLQVECILSRFRFILAEEDDGWNDDLEAAP